MNKPDGWDSAPTYTGESTALPAGGYICNIIQAKEATSNSGKAMLVLLLDIAEGDFTGHFKRQFDKAKEQNPDAKWNGTFYQLTEGKSTPFFKGMITSIEQSNGAYKWDFDETKLKGKKVGAIFGREQYQAADGKLKWSTKCQNIRSVDAVKKGIDPPEDKYLSGYAPTSSQSASPSYGNANDFAEIDDDGDLPF